MLKVTDLICHIRMNNIPDEHACLVVYVCLVSGVQHVLSMVILTPDQSNVYVQ